MTKNNYVTLVGILISTCLVSGQINLDEPLPENAQRIFYPVPCIIRHDMSYSIEGSSNTGGSPVNYIYGLSQNLPGSKLIQQNSQAPGNKGVFYKRPFIKNPAGSKLQIKVDTDRGDKKSHAFGPLIKNSPGSKLIRPSCNIDCDNKETTYYSQPICNNMPMFQPNVQLERRYYLVPSQSPTFSPGSKGGYDPLKGKTYPVHIDKQPEEDNLIRKHQYSTSLLKPIPEGLKLVGVNVPRIISPTKTHKLSINPPENIPYVPLTGLKAQVDTVLTPVCEC